MNYHFVRIYDYYYFMLYKSDSMACAKLFRYSELGFHSLLPWPYSPGGFSIKSALLNNIEQYPFGVNRYKVQMFFIANRLVLFTFPVSPLNFQSMKLILGPRYLQMISKKHFVRPEFLGQGFRLPDYFKGKDFRGYKLSAIRHLESTVMTSKTRSYNCGHYEWNILRLFPNYKKPQGMWRCFIPL